MATLNTGTSVVDYIKSTGGDSSFSSRAKKAVELGIVKSTTQYTGSAQQNISMVQKLKGAVPTTPTKVNNMDSATSFVNAKQDERKTEGDVSSLINGGQDDDIASEGGVPGTRDSLTTLTDFYKSLSDSLNSTIGERPETVSFADRYETLRSDANVSDLESLVTDLESERNDLEAVKRERVAGERDKRVSQGVIEGRVSTVERQENERIDAVNRELSYASNQLNNKYNTINQILQLEQTDYSNSVASYDAKYSQAVNAMQLARGVASDQLSIEEKAKDSARANLQIVYNAMLDGTYSTEDMSDAQKTFITKLETESGLPVGFYENIKSKNATGEIVSTTTRQDSSGAKYADVVMRNADGTLSVTSQYLGKERLPTSGGNDSMTEAELKRKAVSNMGKDLNAITRQDGYTSPEDYKAGKQTWIAAGFSGKDYDDSFSGYAKPNSLEDYGLKY